MNPYYMTHETMAALKAEAQRLGQKLHEMRAQREMARVLERAALPAIPKFKLGE